MRKVVETFVYEIPDDCKNFVSVQDYIWAANDATCPFYDGSDAFIPEVERTIELLEGGS